MKRFVAVLIACGLLIWLLLPGAAGYRDDTKDNVNIRFGMPKETMADEKNRDEYLVARKEFVISYSDKKRIPNWVSWRLVKKDVGETDRGSFVPDPLLPKSFARVNAAQYNSSGFDRGHMCPSGDRAEGQGNDETFVMSNVIPQAPNCNRKAWKNLESFSRSLVKDGRELHIACGSVDIGGFGAGGFATNIGAIKVHVPSRVWKVVLILPKEGAEPTAKTKALAVLLPNNQEVDGDWAKWRVAVKDIEAITGYNFWPKLDKEVAESIKEAVDDTKIESSTTWK